MSRENLFDYLLENLNINREDVKKHQDFYNNHFDEYQNDVYLDPKTRLVHLLNFWEDGFWFNERFKLLFENFDKYEVIIDFGYGLPYLAIHLAENGKLKSLPKQVFIDKYPSAEDISREILAYLKIDATFITKSIESKESFEMLRGTIPPGKKLLVALETIEHLDNPEEFWNNLQEFSGNDMIVSLPVGPKIPSHTLSFRTESEVKDYLSRYIEIKQKHSAQPKELAGRNLDQYQVFSALGTIKQK